MAIELCSSDESSIMSPARISFDISQTDYVPVEQHIRSTSSSSSIDFDFCVFRESFDLESSSADEIFFDGKILPIEIKRRISSTPKKIEQRTMPPPPPLPPCKNNSNPNTSNILDNGKISSNSKNEDKAGFLESIDEKQSSKSFWRFKRSSSLNCGNGYARTLCPLLLLSRSNSTGSTPSVKGNSSSSKDNLSHKQHSQRHFPKSVSSNNCQKPPLKKVSYNNNGVKFSPVLNVPSASLFGLSSFFSSGKEKNKKK